MKVFKCFEELAYYFNKPVGEIERIYDNQMHRGMFLIDNQEIKVHVKENRFNYVIVDDKDNEDCKKYLIEYETNNYKWVVYVDDIEKWQRCELLDVYNNGLEITRAVVRTQYNTQLNRRCNYAFDEEEIKADGCIYFIDKE